MAASPPSPSASAPLQITLRFNIPLPDLTLTVVESLPTVGAVQSAVLSHHPSLNTSTLRFIHRGTLLLPSIKLSTLSLSTSPFIHVVVSSLPPPSAPSSPVATTAPNPPPLPQQPRGFDRLLDAGFTPAEVAALREEFPDLGREGEERWIEEGAGGEGIEQGLGGVVRGVVQGFFWPLGALSAVRHGGSGRVGMAVVAGVGVNLLMGLVRGTS